MPLTFAVLAGETSGDAHGALLVEEIRRIAPDSLFIGVGGSHMRQAGVELLYDSAGWGAIGVIESLRLVRPLTRARDELVKRFLSDPPDLLIPIDFGYFNVRVARPLKAAGVRVLYYFPPRSWSRDAVVSSSLAESVDAVATPFPWSAERFESAGIAARFVGHPMLDALADAPDRAALCKEWQLKVGCPIVALLPGSRRHEVSFLWPRLVQAARRIADAVSSVQFITPVAPSVDRAWLERIVQAETRSHKKQPISLRLVEGRSGDVLSAADVVATCSGTATLEAAVRQKPMLALYGGSALMALEWKLRRRRVGAPFIAMPNIIAGKGIVAELIQGAAAPKKIAEEVVSLIINCGRADRMRQELSRVTDLLGGPGATRRTAEMAIALARGAGTGDGSASKLQREDAPGCSTSGANAEGTATCRA